MKKKKLFPINSIEKQLTLNIAFYQLISCLGHGKYEGKEEEEVQEFTFPMFG